MGLKKAPLLGSSASIQETGPSVVDGDRSLLSHYGASADKQNGALGVSTRKSAALRRHLVARGLARQYGDQKAREEHFKDQVPRYQRQQRILEKYQQMQAKRNASDDKRSTSPERHEDFEDEGEFSENVVLVLRKRTSSAPLKPSGRPTRSMSPVVPPKNATSFLRNASMRQLRENQELVAVEGTDNEGIASARLRHSPREADIPHVNLQPAPRPSSSSRVQEQRVGPATHLPGGAVPWLSAANRSSRVVLCELGITKDIMMREQLVRQLKQTLPTIDSLAHDFLKCQDDYKQTQAALEAAKAMSPSRLKKMESLIGLTLTSPTSDADQVQNAVSEAEVAVTESKARVAELTKRMRLHLFNVEIQVNGLQQATLDVVEGISNWRQMRQRRRQMSNFKRLFRFPWKRRKIPNYLLHLDEDLRTLFPSVALELILGPKATYNPLLLARTAIQQLGVSSTGQTFLTERDHDGGGFQKPVETPLWQDRRGECCVGAAHLKRLKEALASAAVTADTGPSAAKPNAPSIDYDRLRQCLEAIHQEKELETQERRRCGEEEERAQSTYDPFSTIKTAGGVEETLSNMMALHSPASHLLGEELRMRQEDTTRASPSLSSGQSDQSATSTQVLHLNPERLRLFLEKRAALLEPAADCELRTVQRWGQTNKLQGKLLVRKNNEKRVEHHLARKIQLQYLAHRQRHELKHNVSDFVRNVRASVVNIQRVFRGHRAKCDYEKMRKAWREHKRRVSAVRTIINSYRRYRRRLRHRRSMTVESIAQAQLIGLLSGKLSDAGEAQEAAERYRRVGEERRRQRIVLLQKHKMEQQELERKRVAAAVQMQAVVRAHLAQGQVKMLRQERKAHMTAVSAMAIQSTIRKFLNIQQDRRQRFRKDLERVNQSAVRIQSIYRGYNSRASLLGQLDEQTRQTLTRGFTVSKLQEENSDGEDSDESSSDEGNAQPDEMPAVVQPRTEDRLPPIATPSSRPSSGRSTSIGLDERTAMRSRTPTNAVSLPPLWTREGSSSSLLSTTSSMETGSGRRISTGMSRVELKLKEAELGDQFNAPPSRRNSFVGSMRHLT